MPAFSMHPGPLEVNPFMPCKSCGKFGARHESVVEEWLVVWAGGENTLRAVIPHWKCEYCGKVVEHADADYIREETEAEFFARGRQ